VRIEGGGLLLRPFTKRDTPAIVAACQDPEIARWTRVPSPYTERHASEFVSARDETSFAITDLPSGELLGAIGLREHDEGVAEVGYWVKREARGRGVATRALELVAAWAFEALSAARVQLVAEPENEPSLRVAEKAGFTREGVLRSYMEFNGRRRDGVMYSLLRQDPRPQTLGRSG
jgi:RimJ/RimL family protein N-acetyltransferase